MTGGRPLRSEAPRASAARAAANLGLRETGPLDVPVLALLHADCFAGGRSGAVWNARAIAEILALPGAFGYLAAPGSAPGSAPDRAAANAIGAAPGETAAVGFVLARSLVAEAEILSLGVAAAWRRCGVAGRLLETALARAAAAGAQRMLLEVAEDNLAARALYAGQGFAALARRPAYYRGGAGGATAALVFARPLSRCRGVAGRCAPSGIPGNGS